MDLGAKMLTDEHMPTLRALIASGTLAKATTLSFNAISSLTTLPDLGKRAGTQTRGLAIPCSLRSLLLACHASSALTSWTIERS